MIVFRNKYFDDSSQENKEEEEKKKRRKEKLKGAGKLGGSALLAGMAINGTNGLAKEEFSYLATTRNNSKNAEEVKKKLLQHAKDKKIRIKEIDHINTALFLPEKPRLRNSIARTAKSLPKEQRRTYLEPFSNSDIGKEQILLGKDGPFSDADVLSHEFGHAEYLSKHGSGGKIGRAINNVAANLEGYVRNKRINNKIVRSGFFLNGLHSGYKSEKKKEEGKKPGAFTKYKSIIAPIAMNLPILAAEGLASRKGYKLMKEAGADKETLRMARNRLRAAMGSYVAPAIGDIALGGFGHIAGIGLRKLVKPRNKQRQEESIKDNDSIKE